MKRERKRKRRRRRRGFQVWISMDYYEFVWICELLYGFLDFWSSSLSRVFL